MDRWQVRDFYQYVYNFGAATTMQWTGNYDTGDSGTVSTEWLEATRVRVNYFRAMAGIPSNIEFNPQFNAACQDTSLMMSAAKAISHYPDHSWPWYTPDGAGRL